METAHWTVRRRSPSVEPLLRLIERTQGTPYIHRQFSNWDELQGLLGEATDVRRRRYPIVYVACHGQARRIALRDRKDRGGRVVTLRELAGPLRQRGLGKLMLFSACSFMRGSKIELQRFVADTGVSAIMGYQRDVGWIESAQLELGLLASMARWPARGQATRRAALHDLRPARQLMRTLEFRVIANKEALRVPRPWRSIT
jgi:hypothetical protein